MIFGRKNKPVAHVLNYPLMRAGCAAIINKLSAQYKAEFLATNKSRFKAGETVLLNSLKNHLLLDGKVNNTWERLDTELPRFTKLLITKVSVDTLLFEEVLTKFAEKEINNPRIITLIEERAKEKKGLLYFSVRGQWVESDFKPVYGLCEQWFEPLTNERVSAISSLQSLEIAESQAISLREQAKNALTNVFSE